METGQPFMTANHDNNNITNPYRLSIQISLDGLSFLGTTPNGQVMLQHNLDFEVRKNPQTLAETLHKQIEALALPFPPSSVRVVLINDLYTLVPLALFDENSLLGYLDQNIQLLENDFATYDIIQNMEMACVYVPFVNINNMLLDHFEAFEYFHYSTVLIENLQKEAFHNEGIQWFANIQKRQLDLLVFQDNKLLLFNTFPFESPEDFLYYLLFVAEQCNIDPDRVPLHITGHLDKEDATFKITYQYVRDLKFLNPKRKLTPLTKALYPHRNYIIESLF